MILTIGIIRSEKGQENIKSFSLEGEIVVKGYGLARLDKTVIENGDIKTSDRHIRGLYVLVHGI